MAIYIDGLTAEQTLQQTVTDTTPDQVITGLQVSWTGTQYKVTAGECYINGIKVQLLSDTLVTPGGSDTLLWITSTSSIATGTSLPANSLKLADIDGVGGYTQAPKTNFNFNELGDVPASYASQAGRVIVVNAAENGLCFSSTAAGDWATALTCLYPITANMDVIPNTSGCLGIPAIPWSDLYSCGMINQCGMTAPGAAPADSVNIYLTAAGTTPNREVAWKLKNENGDEIVISSVLV